MQSPKRGSGWRLRGRCIMGYAYSRQTAAILCRCTSLLFRRNNRPLAEPGFSPRSRLFGPTTPARGRFTQIGQKSQWIGQIAHLSVAILRANVKRVPATAVRTDGIGTRRRLS